MRSHTLTSITFCIAVASALPWEEYHNDDKRAAYTLSNNPDGANILALELSPQNGTISASSLTSTGGKGLRGLNVGQPFGTAGSPAGPDALFGQGAVRVSGEYLFVVNPGSHTLSMFLVPPGNLLHPKMVGKPADTLAEFPMAVDYSPRLRQACVLNGGAKSGVSCFHVHRRRGLTSSGPLRSLSQGIHQTTPPSGPPGTTSDLRFNPSSTALFATLKSSPPDPGYIYAWPVHNERDISTAPIISSPKTLLLDFSIDFLSSDSTALLTDPSFGASIIAISPDFKVTDAHHTAIPNQGAGCWGSYSHRYDTAYVTDAARTNVTILEPRSGAIQGRIDFEASAKGGFDTAIGGQWMYVLTGDGSVVVIDLEERKQVQMYGLGGKGPVGGWQGMAVYES